MNLHDARTGTLRSTVASSSTRRFGRGWYAVLRDGRTQAAALALLGSVACATFPPPLQADVPPAVPVVQTAEAVGAQVVVARYEVTNELWLAVMGDTPLGRLRIRPSTLDGSWPVLGASLVEVAEFCNRLSGMFGYTAPYAISMDYVVWNRRADGFRLPTEAEWEYAARANNAYVYAGGDEIDEVALVEAARVQRIQDIHAGIEMHPAPVGSLRPNAFGLFDMSGNATEMVWDRFSEEEQRGEFPLSYDRRQTWDARRCKGGAYPLDRSEAEISASRPCSSDGLDPVPPGFRVVRDLPYVEGSQAPAITQG